MVVNRARRVYRKNTFFSSSLTTKLIGVNILCFIVFWILLALKVLDMNSVAIMPKNIIEGKYLWTFLTSMFMHGGFFHLFANMLSLFFVGTLVERILGERRYLSFYLLSGIFASLLFVLVGFWFNLDLYTYAVGASGALFGLIGLLILMTPNLPVYVMFIPVAIKMKYAAPGMLLVLWIISLLAGLPIGNIAHLGGLLFGLIYGFILKIKYPNRMNVLQRYFQ